MSAARPINHAQRALHYAGQTGRYLGDPRGLFSPAQRRRLRHKDNRAIAANTRYLERLAARAGTTMYPDGDAADVRLGGGS